MTEADPTTPLCVTFQLTLADYRGGVRRLAWSLLPVRVIVVIALVAALAGVGSALLNSEPLGIALLLVAVAYALILAWILFVRPGQHYRRRADLKGDQTYCFSDDDVAMSFASGDSRVKWSYFVDLLGTNDLYVLRHSLKQFGSIVPKRAFEGPEAEARFRRLAQQIGKGMG